MRKQTHRDLGGAIRDLRRGMGMTQEELAKRLNITAVHLKNIEAGRRNPSAPVLLHMMRILHLSVDDLLIPNTSGVIHLRGLTGPQVELLERLVAAFRLQNAS